MADTTTFEYQEKQRKKALKQRDSNVKKNEKDNDDFINHAIESTFDKVMEITDKKV